MANLKYTELAGNDVSSFDEMIRAFGVVTVMNAKVYDTAAVLGNTTFDAIAADSDDVGNAVGIVKKFLATDPLCTLDTLKTANVNTEGPTKTITGGQYSNPIIKFGKTATIEIQDALGSAIAVQELCGGLVEASGESYNDGTDKIGALHYGSDFASTKTIIGESFFVSRKTGGQVPVTIVFYQVLPNSVFNLTQDSEGDATVFDMNGDLLTTDIIVSTNLGAAVKHGVFYSVLPRIEA